MKITVLAIAFPPQVFIAYYYESRQSSSQPTNFAIKKKKKQPKEAIIKTLSKLGDEEEWTCKKEKENQTQIDEYLY